MELSTGQIICIVVFNGGFVLLVLLLLFLGKFLRKYSGEEFEITFDENNDITLDQESQFTNSQIFGQHQISIIRTISLPSYENATTCQKVETPPPKYLELFFPTKTSPPTLDPISEV